MELTDLRVGDVFRNLSYCHDCHGEVVDTGKESSKFAYMIVHTCNRHHLGVGQIYDLPLSLALKAPDKLDLVDDFLEWVQECRREIEYREADPE